MIMASNVEARLKQREEARRAAAQQRKAERASGERPEEAAGYFSQQFAAKKAGELVYKTVLSDCDDVTTCNDVVIA